MVFIQITQLSEFLVVDDFHIYAVKLKINFNQSHIHVFLLDIALFITVIDAINLSPKEFLFQGMLSLMKFFCLMSPLHQLKINPLLLIW